MSSELLYAEQIIMCLAVLIIILIKLPSNLNMKANKQFFYLTVFTSIFLFVLDLIWILIDSGYILSSTKINKLVNAFYFSASGFVGVFCFCYCEQTMHPDFFLSKKVWFCFIPIFILLVFSFSSIWTGWLFYVDEYNHYHRGKFYIFQVLLGYSYIIFSASEAIIKALKEKNYFIRQQYITLTSFLIFPTIGVILQTLIYGIPSLCIGITLATLVVFINFQELQISKDPLTQLNNRNHLNEYLFKMIFEERKSNIFLIMFDINGFKKINDIYGHVEGDKALILVADALREACGTKNCFIVRYGGDEFIIVYKCDKDEQINDLINNVKSTIENKSILANTPYKLTVSIGYAKLSKEVHSVQQLINIADENLYKQKTKLYNN